jgi:hypothetical protein
MARFPAQDDGAARWLTGVFTQRCFLMKHRPSLSWVLLAGLAAGALFLSGCSTVNSRIAENRASFDRLSPTDQALISQGKIRGGMTQEAVYIAWGRPQQKATGEVHNKATETWVYLVATPVPAYGYYGGFSGRVGYFGRHGGRRFYGAFYDPFYDPFYYPFPESITQPVKTVSFQRGKVIAFQYLSPAS